MDACRHGNDIIQHCEECLDDHVGSIRRMSPQDAIAESLEADLGCTDDTRSLVEIWQQDGELFASLVDGRKVKIVVEEVD